MFSLLWNVISSSVIELTRCLPSFWKTPSILDSGPTPEKSVIVGARGVRSPSTNEEVSLSFLINSDCSVFNRFVDSFVTLSGGDCCLEYSSCSFSSSEVIYGILLDGAIRGEAAESCSNPLREPGSFMIEGVGAKVTAVTGISSLCITDTIGCLKAWIWAATDSTIRG